MYYFTLILTSFTLLGAVVDSPTGPSSDSPQVAPPTTDIPLPPLPETQPGTERLRYQTPGRQRDMMRKQQRDARMYHLSPYGRRRRDLPPLMPQAPTDNSVGTPESQIYQWLPPTVNPARSRGGGRSLAVPGTMGGQSLIPASPTQARPDLPRNYASRLAVQAESRRLDAARNAAQPANTPTPRPFTNFRAPSSGVSPYMNLYRSGGRGTVDNYSTLVRPALEQRQQNQTFGADIHGLQNTSRVQGLSIRHLGQETQNLQGIHATQYFMNYGDYYSGAR